MTHTPRIALLALAVGLGATGCDRGTAATPDAASTTAATAATAATAVAAGTADALTIDGSAALKARARISGDSAMQLARAEVPSGTIRSGELEEENGALIYSFEIVVPGASGIEEVNVDAMTGRLIGRQHETPADEAHEAVKDSATAARPPA